jgi:predicted RNA-binding protein with TRAM domain
MNTEMIHIQYVVAMGVTWQVQIGDIDQHGEGAPRAQGLQSGGR